MTTSEKLCDVCPPSPGARLLSKLLGENSVLSTLNLADNQVRARWIDRAIHKCRVKEKFLPEWRRALGYNSHSRASRPQASTSPRTKCTEFAFRLVLRGFMKAVAGSLSVGQALFHT